ncbi:MAG: peptidylprolyl isomerase [Spirochaetia bacterium]
MKRLLYVLFISAIILTIGACNQNEANETGTAEIEGETAVGSEPDLQSTSDLSIETGRIITLEYTGTTEDGTVFDSTDWEGREPLTITYGGDALIPGFEEGLLGMKAGESKEIFVPVDKAYGEYSEEAVIQQEIPKSKLPKEIEPEVGLQLVTESQMGPLPVEIIAIGEENVTLEIDTNHPLAGQDLNFAVEIIDVQEAPENNTNND